LQCPECKGQLEPRVLRATEQRIEFGLLECLCSTYPVVGGVVIIRNDTRVERVKQLLSNGEYDVALGLMVGRNSFVPHLSVGERALSAMGRERPTVRVLDRLLSTAIRRRVRRTSVDAWATFEEAVDALLGSESPDWYFDEYLLYRPFGQSFWNLHAVLPLFEASDGPVLDFGGGADHAAHLVSRSTGRPVCNVDTDFNLLYLCTQFLTPGSYAVLISPDRDLPFETDAFDTTLNLDGLHYLENKYLACGELDRVTDEEGELLLLHQHTGEEHPHSGIPLPVHRYRKGVSRDGIVVPERTLLNAFLDAADEFYTRDHPDADGNVNLVFTPDGEDGLNLSKDQNALLQWEGSVVVNPLYDIKSIGDEIRLERGRPSDGYRTEFSFSMAHTESTYTTAGDPSRELLARGVLTLAPDAYASARPIEWSRSMDA
jgi:hypothetical protein